MPVPAIPPSAPTARIDPISLVGYNSVGGGYPAATQGNPLNDYDITEARLDECLSQYLNLSGLPLVDYNGSHGSGNGNVVEPSILYEPNGWNGYKWWAHIMPYDGSTASYENPCIIASNDFFRTFVTPAGITNPINTPASGTHNYDGTILWAPDKSTMIIVWCTLNGSNAYLQFATFNGSTLSATQTMSGTNFATSSHYLNSPALALDIPNSRWVMYMIDNPGSTATGPCSLVYSTSAISNGNWLAALASGWTTPTNMTLNGATTSAGGVAFAPSETVPWHIDMHQLPNGSMAGLLCTVGNTGGRVYPIKVPTVSGSPSTTDAQVGPLLRPINIPITNTQFYRCSAAPVGDRWLALFGTLGLGNLAAPNAVMIAGTIKFDRSSFHAPLDAKIAALTGATASGTLANMPKLGGGLAWDDFGTGSTLALPTAGAQYAWNIESGTFSVSSGAATGSSAGSNKAYLGGATITATIAAAVMTVSATSTGALAVGQAISGTGVTAGSTIASFGTYNAGTGTGTVNLSASSTVSVGEAMTATPSVAASDVDVRTLWKVVSGGGWVTFRRSNSTNYWRAALASGQIQIEKVVAGSIVYPALVNNVSSSNGAVVVNTSNSPTEEFWIRAVGPCIRIYYNRLLVIEVVDAFNSTATTHGLQIDQTAQCTSYLLSAAS